MSRTYIIVLIGLFLLPMPKVSHGGTWELLENIDGIRVFKRDVSGTNLGAFKGEAVIKAPVDRIFSIIADHKVRHQWVDRLMKVSLLKRYKDKPVIIEYIKINMPWPLADRDFVNMSSAHFNSKTGVMKIKSRATTKLAPPVGEGVIRGRTIEANIVIKPLTKNTTFVSMDVLTSLEGVVPNWVVNIAQREWPYKTLSKLRHTATNKNFPIHPRYNDIIKYSQKGLEAE